MKKITFLFFTVLISVMSWRVNAQYFSDGFEGTFPSPWTHVQSNTTITWFSSTTTYQSGTKSIQCNHHGTLPQNEVMMSPVINLSSATAPRVRFWFMMSYYWSVSPYNNYDLQVEGTTNGGATSTVLWTEAAQGVFANWNWYEVTVDLSAFAGQSNFQLILRYQGLDGAQANFDNVVVEETPSCQTPTALTATNVTNDSATLGWTANSGETLWNVQYGVTGFTLGTGTIVNGVTTNPYALSALTPVTTYQYYVQANCGANGTSTWAGPFSFTTQAVTSAPYNEPFNVSTAPIGYNITGWTIGSTRGVTGNPTLNIYKNLWSAATTGTFTTVNINNIQAGMRLYFDYKLANYGVPYGPPAAGSGNFTVSISTDFGANYTVLSTVANDGVAGWRTLNYDMTAYAGQTVKLRFVGTWTSGDYDLAFDNIKIEIPPACPAPSALSATNVTNNSATLGWTAGGSETLWNVQYGVTGFTLGTGTIVNDVTANPYALSGLTPATTYQYYVQANCGANGTSTWVGPFSFATQFVTSAPYNEPFDVSTTPIGYNITGWTIGTTGGVTGNPTFNIYKNLWSAATTGTFTTVNIDNIQAGMRLYFDYKLANFSLPYGPPADGSGNFTVSVSTDFGANYTVLSTVANDGVAGWRTLNYDMTAYAGQTVKLRFVGTWTSGDYYLAFDNIKIEIPPACPAPTALALVNKTATSATFGWNAGASETQWDIEWGTQGFTPGTGTLVTGITNNPYTLNGLSYGVQYSAYVRANCGSGSTSTWVGPLNWFYIDLPQCATLVSPTDGATNIAVGSVNFAWAAPTTGEVPASYNIYYGLTPTTVTSLVGNFTTTSVNLNVTGYNTTIYWQIRPVNAAGESVGCPIWSFTTEPSPFAPYCGPLNFTVDVEPITLVNFAGINNTTSNLINGSPGHENFISIQGEVVKGNTYPIVLKGNTYGNFTNRFVVFIDWNQNAVLNDAGEVYFGDGLLTIVNSTGLDAVQATGNIIVPVDALDGVTRMRVKKLWGTSNTADPCIGGSYGQAEDYSVNVTAAASIADNQINGFNMYPNPVNNTLNLKALNNIDSIGIYNMLGQEMMKVTPSSTQVQLDMAKLSSGTYVVKVQSGAQIGAYSLIKL